jgi:hypothetical protein
VSPKGAAPHCEDIGAGTLAQPLAVIARRMGPATYLKTLAILFTPAFPDTSAHPDSLCKMLQCFACRHQSEPTLADQNGIERGKGMQKRLWQHPA